jgi:hypothetical protein
MFTVDSVRSFPDLVHDLGDPDLWPTKALINTGFNLTDSEKKLRFPVETEKVSGYKQELVNRLNSDVLPKKIFDRMDVLKLPDVAKDLWDVKDDFGPAELERFNRYMLALGYPSLRDKSAPYTNAYFWCDTQGPYAVFERTNAFGGRPYRLRVTPLLRLTIDTNSNPGERMPAVVATAVNYKPPFGEPKKYFIGDFYESELQNRVVFTMLTYLYNQTAVSTTNLPVQQLIHLQ